MAENAYGRPISPEEMQADSTYMGEVDSTDPNQPISDEGRAYLAKVAAQVKAREEETRKAAADAAKQNMYGEAAVEAARRRAAEQGYDLSPTEMAEAGVAGAPTKTDDEVRAEERGRKPYVPPPETRTGTEGSAGSAGSAGGADPGALPGPAPGYGPVMVRSGGMKLDETKTHMGKEVPEETWELQGASGVSALRGAELKRDADQEFGWKQRELALQNMRAQDEARVQHAAVQAERDAEVQRRLAEIQQINAEANQKVGASIWDNGPLAGIIGAIAIGAGQYAATLTKTENGAMKMIEANLNRQIKAQIENNAQAGKRADQAKTLLGLHLQRFGDMDRAIDATKAGLYDSVLMQMESYKAQHGAQISDANYNQMVSDITGKQADIYNKLHAQEQNDVVNTEKRHDPVFMGGGGGGVGGGAGTPGNLLNFNGSTYEIDNQTEKNRLAKQIQLFNELRDMNMEGVKLRNEIRKLDITDRQGWEYREHRLKMLDEQKAKAIEQARDQGVLRDAERPHAMQYSAMFTEGLPSRLEKLPAGVAPFAPALKKWNDAEFDGVNDALRAQAKDFEQTPRRGIDAAHGRLVANGYSVKVDNNGRQRLVPDPLFTGQDAGAEDRPRYGLPPSGATSSDPRAQVFPTKAPPDTRTVPRSPILGPATRDTPASGKKKK
jgi:hypothetical protein